MRLVDAELLDEEVMHWFMCMTGNPKPTTVVNQCKSSFRNISCDEKIFNEMIYKYYQDE